MVTYDDGGNASPSSGSGVLFRLFSTHHKTIGLQYLWLALASVLVGMVLSALLRLHATWPDRAIPFLASTENTPERFAAMRLLHGSLMVFFVLTAAPQLGFGNYLLPLQIGANEMAFPSLNRLSFWMTVGSLVGMTASFFLPLANGINLWHASAALFSLAALFSALNFAHDDRNAREGHDFTTHAGRRVGVVRQRDLEPADLQRSAGGMRRGSFGPPAGIEFFQRDFVPGSATAEFGASRKPAHPLAAALLVFCASGSVRGDAAVLWHRHAPGGDVFPQAGVEGAPGGAGPVRRGAGGILRVGLPHVCHRHESLRAAGFFGAGIFPGDSGGVPAG